MRCKDIIISYFKKHGARYFIGLVFVVVSTVLNTIIPQLIGKAIDLVDGASSVSESMPGVLHMMFLLTMCVLGAFVTRFVWRLLIFGFTRSIELHVRHVLFTHLQALSPEYYVKNNTGDLITKSIIDTMSIRMMLGMGIIGIVDILTINSVTIGYMISTTRLSLTLIAIIPLPILLYTLVRIRTLLRRRFAEVQRSVSDIAEKVQENITGIRVIKAFAQEQSENEHFETLSRSKWKAEMGMVKISALIQPISALAFGVIFSLFLYIGGDMVIKGTITLGEFVAFNTYIAYLLDPINRLSRIIQVWQRGIVSMQRMDTILTATPAINDNSADFAITDISPIDISVKNLTFRYPDTDVDVLKDITFDLPKGGVLAVMGATGSGKSTLLSLLMRMWNPPVNSILISGYEPEKIPLCVLRSTIAYVPQETFLFSDSVKNNIIFYDESVSEEDAIQAAKSAAVHNNILELSNGYETVVGERGMTLSGGQKQRVSISRALARKPSLLLLDDCLSAVDSETEHAILSNLKEYFTDCTTIIVTHRVAAAGIADRVLLLNEDGSMAGIGTHDELSKTSPEYQNLLKIIESAEATASNKVVSKSNQLSQHQDDNTN